MLKHRSRLPLDPFISVEEIKRLQTLYIRSASSDYKAAELFSFQSIAADGCEILRSGMKNFQQIDSCNNNIINCSGEYEKPARVTQP